MNSLYQDIKRGLDNFDPWRKLGMNSSFVMQKLNGTLKEFFIGNVKSGWYAPK